MALRGRPRIFVTQAEKQKAYRDRKREEEALRKSSGSILKEPYPPCEFPDLFILWQTKEQIGNDCDRHAHMLFWSPEFLAMGYDEWRRLRLEFQVQWEKAHDAWYSAWKAAGFPPGECSPKS